MNKIKNNKEMLIIGLGLLLIALILGGGLLFTMESSENNGNDPGEEIRESENDVARIMREAATEGDVSFCEEILQEEKKRECREYVYLSLAIKNEDFSFCEEISNSEKRTNCEDNVYLSLAIKNKDESICSKISDESLRQQCPEHVELLGE